MDITIIIPNYEYPNVVSLVKSIPENINVIVVDDVSQNKAVLPNLKNLKVINMETKGYFSGAVNAGMKACDTDVLILNQDVVLQGTSWLDIIAQNKDQYDMIGEGITGGHPAWPKGYIHGTFMYMSRKAIKAVGLLNEKYYPLWGSTCEWQLRACRKGFKILPLKTIPGFVHLRDRGENYGSSIKKVIEENWKRRNLFIRTPPLISIIVPCYNHGRFVPDLVNSLIGGHTDLGDMDGQTLQSFEIVIADDCSTDNTAEILKGLVDPWKGIRSVRTAKNSGTSVACNLAIDNCVSELICRIDSDDMREPNSLEIMYDTFVKNPHSFVYDDVRTFGPNGRATKKWKMPEFDYNELIYKNNVHAGIMFSKTAWRESGKYSPVMRNGRDDWAFNVALGLKGYCGVHVANAGYLYRRHENNRTLQNTTPRWREKFLITIQRLYPEAYSEERPKMCCGNGRASSVQSKRLPPGASTFSAKSIVSGSSGTAIVEYLGGNYGNQAFYGPATGQVYVFSVKKKFGNVDLRDLNHTNAAGQKVGFLDIMEGRHPVFQMASQAAVDAHFGIVKSVAEDIKPAVVEKKSPVLEKKSTSVDLPFSEDAPAVEPADPDDGVTYVDQDVVDALANLNGSDETTAFALIGLGYDTVEKVAMLDPTVLAEEVAISKTRSKLIIKSANAATSNLA